MVPRGREWWVVVGCQHLRLHVEVGAVDVLHEGDDRHQLGVVVERLPRENLRRRVPRNEPSASERAREREGIERWPEEARRLDRKR